MKHLSDYDVDSENASQRFCIGCPDHEGCMMGLCYLMRARYDDILVVYPETDYIGRHRVS